MDCWRRLACAGAQIGLLVVETGSGNALYARNADQEFTPASNFKLLVGSAALRRLGPNFTFTTTLSSDQTPANGVLSGNVYLRGGGDAHLTASDLDGAAAAVARAGIVRVSGSLVTDSSHDDDRRWGLGWSWDDLPYAYAPVVSGLELEDGSVHVFVVPGAAAGSPASVRVDPQSSAFVIDNRVQTGTARSQDTTDVERPWNAPQTIVLTGSYPAGAGESDDLEPSVPDPEAYAGDVLLRALTKHGITVDGGVRTGRTPAGATPLWSHASAPLSQMLAAFWYPSDNLMGELFLKELGVAHGGEPGTDENGEREEEAYLRTIGVDPASLSIVDGSGLSQYDRITPRALVAILQSDWHSPQREIVVDALPLAGVRGTLAHVYLRNAGRRARLCQDREHAPRTRALGLRADAHPRSGNLLVSDQRVDGRGAARRRSRADPPSGRRDLSTCAAIARDRERPR